MGPTPSIYLPETYFPFPSPFAPTTLASSYLLHLTLRGYSSISTLCVVSAFGGQLRRLGPFASIMCCVEGGSVNRKGVSLKLGCGKPAALFLHLHTLFSASASSSPHSSLVTLPVCLPHQRGGQENWRLCIHIYIHIYIYLYRSDIL